MRLEFWLAPPGPEKGEVENEAGSRASNLPSDEILSLHAQLDVVGEVEALSPVDDLAIRVVAVLGAERGPANQTFKHNGAQ